MSSSIKSKEFNYFKTKLNDMIVSLQSLSQSEWEEAINLIYLDLGCTIKASISINGLPQYGSSNKDLPCYSVPLKADYQRVDKPNENSHSNGALISENLELSHKRAGAEEKHSNVNNVLNKDLSHVSRQPKRDLPFKNNFIDSTVKNQHEQNTYSILNLCSKNKNYDDKKNISSEEVSPFGSTISKKKYEEGKRDRENLHIAEIQSNTDKIPNDNYGHYDYYEQSDSDQSKLYICNDMSICPGLNDPINNSQKRSNYMDIKSKSTELSLWKLQPEIYSEFQSNLVENLDLFNVNFNKQENTTEMLPDKDQGECTDVKIENESFSYNFSNNFAEIQSCKGTTCNNAISTDAALNLINKKDITREPHNGRQLSGAHSFTRNDPKIRDAHSNDFNSPICCLNCKSEIEDVSAFNRHQLNCFSCKFFCIHCNIQFNNRMNFAKHLVAHEQNNCKKCSTTFCHYSSLKQHMEDSHNINLSRKMFSCQYCNRSFFKQASLFHHYNLHTKDNQKVCEKCGIFCSDDSDFNQHMSIHFKTELQCLKCNEIFLRKQQYEKHLRTHENYKCDYCTRTFSCKRKLHQHCKTEHRLKPKEIKLDKQYSCEQCMRTFTRPSYLKLHKETHSGIKPLECAICNKRFNERRNLRKHRNTYLHQYNLFLSNNTQLIEAENNFSCQFCQLQLPSEKLLRFHCDLTHKEVKLRKCLKCDFKTNSKEEYKKHAKCHSRKLFVCEICGKDFTTHTTLKDHHIYLHSTDRNFTCNLCSKSFKTNSVLLRHVKTHIPDKLYNCKCGSGFKQMSNLVRHIDSVHREERRNRKQKNSCVHKKEVKQNTEDCIDTSIEYKNNSIGANNNLVLTNDTMPSEPQFTVFDSQLIQLVPSTLQFDENIQSVAIINSDLTRFSLPSGYAITQSNDSLVDSTNIEHDIIGSHPYSQLTPMASEHSKNTKKKGFNVEIDNIGVQQLSYNINKPDSVSLQSGDVPSSMKEQNVSGAASQINIIF